MSPLSLLQLLLLHTSICGALNGGFVLDELSDGHNFDQIPSFINLFVVVLGFRLFFGEAVSIGRCVTLGKSCVDGFFWWCLRTAL